MSILLNVGNGNGVFAAGVNYAVGARLFSVAIGDLNGDDKPAAWYPDCDAVGVLLNKVGKASIRRATWLGLPEPSQRDREIDALEN